MSAKKKKSKKRSKALSPAQVRIKERQRKAMDLAIRGVKQEHIAEQLGVTERQVARDMDAIRTELALELDNLDAQKVISQLTDAQKARMREYWRLLTEPEASRRDKIRALNALRDEESEYFKRLQAIGIVPRERSGVEINSVGATKVELFIDQKADKKKDKE